MNCCKGQLQTHQKSSPASHSPALIGKLFADAEMAGLAGRGKQVEYGQDLRYYLPDRAIVDEKVWFAAFRKQVTNPGTYMLPMYVHHCCTVRNARHHSLRGIARGHLDVG